MIAFRSLLQRGCSSLSHVSKDGTLPNMVNVSNKTVTKRIAHAQCTVLFPTNLLKSVVNDNNEVLTKKGPVATTAIDCG